MNRIKSYFALQLLLMLLTLHAAAQPKAGYYSNISGKKQVELKLALKAIISKHTKLSYDSSLPEAYESVYYQDGKKNYVYDMFSYDNYTFSSSKWNKEHVIPNSWWGKTKNNAYSDIFSVIPSESTANNRKSNFPIGTVGSDVSFDNGCIKVGTPVDGQGGTYTHVFEPADEYKGDFARIYFYVATCYSDIAWGSGSVDSEISKEDWPTLNPWLYKLLLKWHNQDPVSEKEVQINNSAEVEQGNRNPFIDYPVLADYIWGTYQSVGFDLSTAQLYKHVSGAGPDAPTDPTDPTDPKDPTDPIEIADLDITSTLFTEDFEVTAAAGNNTSTGGSSSLWDGNDNFPTASYVYKAGGAVRMASGSNAGSMTSKTISFAGGIVVLQIKVKGWSEIEGPFSVTLGSEKQTVTYTSTISDDFETVTLVFRSVAANPKLTIETAKKQRCFIDEVTIYAATEKPAIMLGDANDDGVVDALDASFIQQYVAGKISIDNEEAADVNQDGVIDAQDASLIQQKVAGK